MRKRSVHSGEATDAALSCRLADGLLRRENACEASLIRQESETFRKRQAATGR